MASKGLLPTVDDANNALAYSERPQSDPILRWMAGRGIHPNKTQEQAYRDIQMKEYPNLYPNLYPQPTFAPQTQVQVQQQQPAKIINPETGRHIQVGKGVYNQLLKKGYANIRGKLVKLD